MNELDLFRDRTNSRNVYPSGFPPQKCRALGLIFPADVQYRRLTVAIQFVAIALGAVQTWNVRHAFDPDGVSYLEIGDAYVGRDWAAAINAYWSPLYSWVLGLAMLILKPSPYWEFATVHLVNFGIYVWTLICFNLFLRELIRHNQLKTTASIGNEDTTLPILAWLALGYSLFISSALALINIKSVSPDMILAGLVYLASGILLRICAGSTGWLVFVLLGSVLGAGYLTKAALLPLALVFLAVSLLSVGNLRIAIPRTLVALIVFVMAALPFIVALSVVKGRLTAGDTAKLNYAWFVNRVPAYAHWQGLPAGNGTPEHPTRELSNEPEAYEFATPIGGTYPPWYDPSYWYEGAVVRFDLRQQLWRLAANGMAYLNIFTSPQILPITGFLLFCLMANRSSGCVKRIAENWVLIVPAIASLGMYSLVLVTTRFIAPFLVLLCFGIASGVRVVSSQDSKKLLAQMSMAILIVIILSLSASMIRLLTPELIGQASQFHPQWKVADGLTRMGLHPGDKVAFIGDSFFAYWARIARVRIVAEIPRASLDKFRTADPESKSHVLDLLGQTGAKMIVTNELAIYQRAVGTKSGILIIMSMC